MFRLRLRLQFAIYPCISSIKWNFTLKCSENVRYDVSAQFPFQWNHCVCCMLYASEYPVPIRLRLPLYIDWVFQMKNKMEIQTSMKSTKYKHVTFHFTRNMPHWHMALINIQKVIRCVVWYCIQCLLYTVYGHCLSCIANNACIVLCFMAFDRPQNPFIIGKQMGKNWALAFLTTFLLYLFSFFFSFFFSVFGSDGKMRSSLKLYHTTVEPNCIYLKSKAES